MKRPTWVTVIGIIGILLGFFRILGSAQTAIMPTMMEFQKEMMMNVQTLGASHSGQEKADEEILKFMSKIFDMPGWYKPYSLIVGLVGAIIAGLYLYASITLLLLKRNAVKCFYIAASLYILLNIVKGVASIWAKSFFAISMAFGGVFGIVIDIVLIIVVVGANKDAFKQNVAAA